MIAIKNKDLLDYINPQFKNIPSIKFILTEDVNDFAKDSIIKPQQDPIKFMHYNSYLNKKDIKITTTQFSKLLNCSYDYLGCDEATLDFVRYLMIDTFLNQEILHDIKQLEFINQIEYIYTHLYYLEQARSNPEKYPLASVVMSCHNRDYYLLVSVQHVLQQTYVNWELLISDDGSSNPKTLQILQLIQNIPRSRGEFVAIQDDDDIMMPFRLEYQIDFLKRNPEYEVCASAYMPVTEIGVPKYYASNYVHSFDEAKALFMQVNFAAHSTFTVRMTDRMKKYYIYNHQTAYDYSLWLKLLFDLENEDIRFFSLPRHVTGIRVHSQRMSHNSYEYSHYQKWIPLKQIEIAEKISPDIYENASYQYYQHQQFELQKKIFACIYHQGSLQKLLTNIGQLKDFVDNFIIVYVLTPSEYQIMNEIFNNPMFSDYQSKNTLHIIKVTGTRYKGYIDSELPNIFTRLLEDKNLQDQDYILLSNTSEFINPFQLKRFYQLSQDFGIFGLRYLQSVDKEDYLYQKTKIISYHLFRNIGYKAIREYVIDEDIFKLVPQPRFEDKLYTLFINGEYLNVNTMKDAGIFIDDCQNYQPSLANKPNYKDNTFSAPSQKRKLENFYISSNDIFQSYCGINIEDKNNYVKTEL
ncbi:UNKNOWN [Stylonychia lemnae]|uniref:Glycosyltransferase 2-like domain-containing protein n=1 Tax=Stylonychia lemnae TaxID=5949 RepID=A0A078B4C1_STYLE|nr:UNKNOWN [Stylonychia lemnae]|eukprot:CDW88062.1 UNKNOWN [Stylonychia lemnae]